MRFLTFIFFFVTISSSLCGQPPKWAHFQLFAGQSFDAANAIKIDSKDNYYITTTSQNPLNPFTNDTVGARCNFIQPVTGTYFNASLFRYDSSRNLNLSIKIENSSLGEFVIDSFGNIYITGVFQYGDHRDAFIKKFSASGSLLWTKLVQSTLNGNDNTITSIDLFDDGSIILCGFSYGRQVSLLGQMVVGPNNFITKINFNGNIIWTKNFCSDLGMGAYKVRFDKAGDILVAGNGKIANTNNSNAVIAKLNNATGVLIWKKQFPSAGLYTPMATAIDISANAYLFCGTFGGHIQIGDSSFMSSGASDIFLFQCDTAGNINWAKKAGSKGRDGISSLFTGKSGITYFTGQFSNDFQFDGESFSSKGNTDVFIGAIDSLGNTRWILTGGSNLPGHNDDILFDENGNAIAVDSKNQIHIVGETLASGNFGGLKYEAPEAIKTNGFWLTLGGNTRNATVQYDCNEMFISNASVSISAGPNPFNSSIVVSNSKDSIMNYEICLYNGMGQLVDRRHYMSSSSVTITEWNILPSGIYFLRINTSILSKTYKFVKK